MTVARPIYAFDKPSTVAGFISLSAQLACLQDGSRLVEAGSKFVVYTGGEQCDCQRCENLLREVAQLDFFDLPVFMIVCKACGNKRCPKALDHAQNCELPHPTEVKS